MKKYVYYHMHPLSTFFVFKLVWLVLNSDIWDILASELSGFVFVTRNQRSREEDLLTLENLGHTLKFRHFAHPISFLGITPYACTADNSNNSPDSMARFIIKCSDLYSTIFLTD